MSKVWIVLTVVVVVVGAFLLVYDSEAENLCQQVGTEDEFVVKVRMMSAIVETDGLAQELRKVCPDEVDRLLGVNVGR